MNKFRSFILVLKRPKVEMALVALAAFITTLSAFGDGFKLSLFTAINLALIAIAIIFLVFLSIRYSKSFATQDEKVRAAGCEEYPPSSK